MASSLADVFLQALPSGVSAPESLTTALEALVRSAKQAWPDLELDDDVFVRHVAERLQAGMELDAVHAGDLYLALGCLLGAPAALQSFERTAMVKVSPALRGNLPHGTTLDDVLQQLRVKLFVQQGETPPRISGYSGRGALVPWLRAAAVRLVQDAARVGHRELATDDEALLESPALRSGGLDVAYVKQRYAPEFKAAFTEAMTQLSARDRNILRAYYLDGLSPDDIGRLYRTHRTTVWRWLTQCRDALLDTTRALLSKRLALPEAEFSGLMRDVQSQLDVSINRLLKEEPSS